MNTTVNFRTFDDLLTAVLVDFRVLDEEGMIEPAQLIKIARQVNYDLGLRINQTKETIIDVQDHVAKLPEDFSVINFALLIGHHTETSQIDWGGRVTENIDAACPNTVDCCAPGQTKIPYVPTYGCCPPGASLNAANQCTTGNTIVSSIQCPCCPPSYFYNSLTNTCVSSSGQVTSTIPCIDQCIDQSGTYHPLISCASVSNCGTGPQLGNSQFCLKGESNTCTPEQDPFSQNRVFSMCDGNKCVKVIEKRGVEVREYEHFARLYIKAPRYLDPGSINRFRQGCEDEAEIKNGYLYLNTKDHCKIYLSYLGSLEDEQGNLLVLDHPEINMYYEAALKSRILENLYYAGEEVKEKLQYAKEELKQAKLRALTIVNMPDFAELVATWKLNRDLQHQRYYNYWRTNVFQQWNNSFLI